MFTLPKYNFTISNNDKIAIIGENGCGKTTLLKQLHNDYDSVLVDQHIQDQTISTKEFFNLEEYDFWKIDFCCDQVQLFNTDYSKLISKYSGGEKTKLLIAKALISSIEYSKILLLDEPTNNLDSKSLKWLTEFVKGYKAPIVIVSHDRYFIDSFSTKIIAFENNQIIEYSKNYSHYIEQKEKQFEIETKEYKEYLNKKQQLQNALTQAKTVATKGTKTKVRDNDKCQRDWFQNKNQRKGASKAKALETKISQMEVKEKPTIQKQYSTNIVGSVHSKKYVIKINNLSKSINDKALFKNFNLDVIGQQRIRIEGNNGCGKTTLFNMILDKIHPDKGTISIGIHDNKPINIGYFSQSLDILDYSISPFDNLYSVCEDKSKIFHQSKILGINPDELNYNLDNLSYGQQVKICFAKILLMEYQLLILDEPTNHLDIKTKEIIENALNNYHGAMLIASHDQYFINMINIDQFIKIENPI